MRLRDDAFMYPETAATPARQPLGQLKAALSGVGDPQLRQAQDFLWSMGLDMPGMDREAADQDFAGWRPAVGDEVEFALPHGDTRRAGRIHELTRTDAIVQVGAGEYNIVPLPLLAPIAPESRRAAKKAEIRQAMRGGGGAGSLAETRGPMPLGTSGDYTLTLQYQAGRAPSGEDVQEYVQLHYPQARIVDGDDSYPGRLSLVLAFPKGAQLAGPSQPPSSRMNATGIGSEEIEGTGKIGDAALEMAADGYDTAGAGAGPGTVDAAPPPMSQLTRRDYDRMRRQTDPSYQTQDEERQKALQRQRNLERHRQLNQQHAPDHVPPPATLGGPGPGSGPGEHNSAGDDDGPDVGAGGTGMALQVSGRILERIAALNTDYDFIEGAIEEREGGGVISNFTVSRAGRPLFIREGGLTPVLAAGAIPAEGWVQVDTDGLRTLTGVWLHGTNGPMLLRSAGLEQGDATYDVLSRTAGDAAKLAQRALSAVMMGKFDIAMQALDGIPEWDLVGVPRKLLEGLRSEVRSEARGVEGPRRGMPPELVQAIKGLVDKWERTNAGPEGDFNRERPQILGPAGPDQDPMMLGPGEHEAADEYQSMGGPLPSHENEPGANETGSYVVKADGGVQSPVATEEDGETRETIGGPGLHVAVDQPAKDYWAEYYGDYGSKLTDDVATRMATTVRQAWSDAGRDEPTANEMLWVLGVFAQTKNAARYRTADAPGAAAHPHQTLADQLIEQSANSSQAEQAIQSAIANYLSRLPDKQRGTVNQNDPAVVKKILPAALGQMSQVQRQMLQTQFGQGYKPGVGDRAMDVARGVGQWAKDKVRLPSTRRRQETQRSREFNQLTAPETPPGEAPAAPGAAPGAPADGGESLPAGTQVTTDKGDFVLTGPAQAKPAGGGQPAKPQTPATPQNDPLGSGGVEEPPPAMGAAPAPPESGILQLTPEDEVHPDTPLGRERRLPQRMPMRQRPRPTAPPQQEAPLDLSGYDPDLAPGRKPQPQASQKEGAYVELPAGTSVYEVVKGGRMVAKRIKEAVQGHVYRHQGDMTFIRTEDDELLAIQRPGATAARKPRSVPPRTSKPYADGTPSDAYAGRLPPAKAHLGFRMEGLVRRGDYLVMAVVWDADATKDMAPASVVQNLKSYVKQRSSEKEFTDIGWIGKPVIEMLDLRAGLAEVKFRSSEARIAPPEFIQKEDGSYHEPLR